ncbi:MAG: methionyl-tRNA formyltransferase [Clostridia bacterium]|nr:methionyl-tRNA formyltransferase [Clostridia bacterium]
MRIVFMGTPEFAVPSLRFIAENPDLKIVGVVTQPDRPKGRGKKLKAPPVKELALELGLPLIQPASVNSQEALDVISRWNPDAVVVVAFGQILKSQLLSLPPKGCINLHASLLPRYRGAAPIHWAIINGEKVTGVTTQFMSEKLDAGDILLQEEVEIGPEETVGELHDRLADIGGRLLVKTLLLLAQGRVEPRKQDESMVSYAPLLTPEDEIIHWNREARDIVNHIRGMNPWPGVYTKHNGRILKIWRARVYDEERVLDIPGKVVDFDEEGFVVQAGRGQIVVVEVQPEGKSKMFASDFINGRNIEKGQILGEESGNSGGTGDSNEG